MKKLKSSQKNIKNIDIVLSPNYTEHYVPDPGFAKKVKEAEEFLAKYPPNEKLWKEC